MSTFRSRRLTLPTPWRGALLATAAVVGMGVSACTPTHPRFDGEWVLEEAVGADGAAVVLVDGHPVTLNLSGDRASGRSACNNYSGTRGAQGEAPFVGDWSQTQMACDPPEVMALEAAYLAALLLVEEMALDGDDLVLTGEGVELRFASAS